MEYVFSDIKRPAPILNPVGTENWNFNDNYTAILIFKNISAPQKVHAGQEGSAFEMWCNLKAIYEITGHTTIINYICMLYKCNLEKGDNILEHLSNLKVTWKHIHALGVEEFKISDLFFKVIISLSLLPF